MTTQSSPASMAESFPGYKMGTISRRMLARILHFLALNPGACILEEGWSIRCSTRSRAHLSQA